MTRELHVYDHASAMIALLFVSPNGTVEAFDVEGFNRIGEFASVAEAATFACADVEMPRLDSLISAQSLRTVIIREVEPVRRAARSGRRRTIHKNKTPHIAGFCRSAHRTAGDRGGDRGHPSAPYER